MEFIVHFLTQYGYWGMLLAAFLAGSFFPFSSEAVMIGLMATGLDPWLLMIYGTIGNVLGSIVNYFVGRMGKMEWIEKYLHVSKESLEKAHRFLAGHGAWMGFFAFLPHRHHPRKDFSLHYINLWRGIIPITLIYVEGR